MLKHTAPAAPCREATPDEIKRSLANIHARVARMGRASFLVGEFNAAELEGAIVLLEAARRRRRVLPGLTSADADEALAIIVPDESF